MNKVIKDNKIAMPITRAGIKQMCKALNLHCTETTAFEAIIACRGKHMDDSPPEEFNFDRLVQYLQFKSKFMPPVLRLNFPKLTIVKYLLKRCLK